MELKDDLNNRIKNRQDNNCFFSLTKTGVREINTIYEDVPKKIIRTNIEIQATDFQSGSKAIINRQIIHS